MIGIPVTMPAFNALIGHNALTLKQEYDVAQGIKTFLDAHPPAGTPLVDPLTVDPFSFTADEAATIRTAYADLDYQAKTAFGSSAAVKKLYGVGEVL